jgi:hypothetical protein
MLSGKGWVFRPPRRRRAAIIWLKRNIVIKIAEPVRSRLRLGL